MPTEDPITFARACAAGCFAVRQLADGTWIAIVPDPSSPCYIISVAPVALHPQGNGSSMLNMSGKARHAHQPGRQ
jgi:hypothetical protein